MKILKKIIAILVLALVSCNDNSMDNNQPSVIIPPTTPVPQIPPQTHTLIPNVKFEQALIDLKIDDVLDGKILNTSAEAVTKLVIEHKGIEDVTGLSAFKNLTHLALWDNKFTTIDLTQLTKLISLNLSECPINTIDLSKNKELEIFEIFHRGSRANDPTYPFGKTTGLTSLDLRNNTKLVTLWIQLNRISTLDVSMLPNLTQIWIGNNDGYNDTNTIESLDLSKNPRLYFVILQNMPQLNYLNVTGSNPFRINTLGCPKLPSITVSNRSIAMTKYASGAWEKDPNCIILD